MVKNECDEAETECRRTEAEREDREAERGESPTGLLLVWSHSMWSLCTRTTTTTHSDHLTSPITFIFKLDNIPKKYFAEVKFFGTRNNGTRLLSKAKRMHSQVCF